MRGGPKYKRTKKYQNKNIDVKIKVYHTDALVILLYFLG